MRVEIDNRLRHRKRLYKVRRNPKIPVTVDEMQFAGLAILLEEIHTNLTLVLVVRYLLDLGYKSLELDRGRASPAASGILVYLS
jgi:hypothetical protein